MINYRVIYDKRIKQQIRNLPGKLRQEAIQQIANLSLNPRPDGAKELRGFPHIYRIWLSDARYRLIWELFEVDQIVEIHYVGLKPDYENLLR